jgi:hypothetical protein
MGGTYTIPAASPGHHYRCGGVSSNSATDEATKFVGPHKSHIRQYIIELAHRSQMIDP